MHVTSVAIARRGRPRRRSAAVGIRSIAELCGNVTDKNNANSNLN